MTDDKIIELVNLVHSRTSVGTLKWEETVSPNMLQTTLSKYVIRIKVTANQAQDPDEVDYEISLVNSDGITLDSITDIELSKLLKNIPGQAGTNGYILMADIFKNAKRKALGVDKAYDDVLKELTDLPPF